MLQAVARLTADNLVFMACLRAAEAGAAAATAERDELRLALEQHKGPWMDEVCRLISVMLRCLLAKGVLVHGVRDIHRRLHSNRIFLWTTSHRVAKSEIRNCAVDQELSCV
jgi:hypothetical protein